MVDLVQKFLIIAIIVYCIHMIYFYYRDKSKKYKNLPTIEMNYLIRIYNIDISMIGVKLVKKHISLINSIIASIDLLIYYSISNSIIKLFVLFIVTFLLVLILYSILGMIYRKIIYR